MLATQVPPAGIVIDRAEAEESIRRGQKVMSGTEHSPVLFETLDQVRWFSFEDGWQGESRGNPP